MIQSRLGFVVVLAAGCHSSAQVAPDADPASLYAVEVTTDKGTFIAEVHPEWAPNGAARFRELVDAGFYDDVRFFRVITGFVAQFGINGTPAVDAMWNARTIPDDPVVGSNKPGTISFAQTSAADSRTTQLFINLVDNRRLDAMGFAPFAIVTSGMDVVSNLEAKYGEAPNQTQLTARGNPYLATSFPDLDYIVTAKVR